MPVEDDLELIDALLHEMDDGLPLYEDEQQGDLLQKFDCAHEQHAYEWMQQKVHLQSVPSVQEQFYYPRHNSEGARQIPSSPLVPRSRQTLLPRVLTNSYLDRPVFAAEPSPLARETTLFEFPSPVPVRRLHPFQQGEETADLSCIWFLLTVALCVQVSLHRDHRAAVMFSLSEWRTQTNIHPSNPAAAVPVQQVLCLKRTA